MRQANEQPGAASYVSHCCHAPVVDRFLMGLPYTNHSFDCTGCLNPCEVRLSISVPFTSEQRPRPRGVMPERLWLEDRAEELAVAIADHIEQGYTGDGHRQQIGTWIGELQRVWARL